MRIRVLFVIILFLYGPVINAQNLDSLKSVLAKQPQRDTVRLKTLNALCDACKSSYGNDALIYGEEALALGKKLKSHRNIVTSLLCISKMYFYDGNYKKSIEVADTALAYAHAHDPTYQYYRIISSQAWSYESIGNFAKALELNFQCLNLLAHAKRHKGLVNVYYGMASIYSKLGDRTTSAIYLSKADSLSGVHLKSSGKGFTHGNVQPDDIRKVILHYKQKLPAIRSAGDTVNLIFALGNLGRCLMMHNEIAQAENYISEAYLLSQKTGIKRLKLNAIENMAKLHVLQKHHRQAVKLYEELLALYKPTNDRAQIEHIYFSLAKEYSALHHYQDAFENIRKAYVIKDSLNQQEVVNKLAGIQKDYEIRKRQLEINNLRKDAEVRDQDLKYERTIRYGLVGGLFLLAALTGTFYYSFRTIKRKNKIIESINLDLKAQALRSQMNPHFIFNALNSIQYLALKGDDSLMHYLSTFSTLLRSILDNADREWTTVREEIETLRLYVELESLRFDKDFDYTIDIQTTEEITDSDKIPTMVVQPFVENAILHGLLAKDGNKKLSIVFSKERGVIRCSIVDNGIGRDAAGKIRKSRIMNHQSKGIRLTTQRLQVLDNLKNGHSAMAIHDLKQNENETSGTEVHLTFEYA